MIVDYEASKRNGRAMALAGAGRFSEAVDEIAGGKSDETMPLRVVVPIQPTGNSGGNGGEYKPWPIPDDDPDGTSPKPAGESRPEPVVRWTGPFPVRRVGEMNDHGNPPPITTSFVHADRPLFIREQKPEPNDEKPEGVEHDTGTFALPAVLKLTGKPSTKKLAHRSAARVQQTFNDAGWNIAVWYGEATSMFWVMDENGLHEFESLTAMYQGMGWQAL